MNMEEKKAYQKNIKIEDPRQSLFFALFIDPKSKTFANAHKSALKAGFKEEYAKTLASVCPNWLVKKMRKNGIDNMVAKARRNLDEFLDMETDQMVALKDNVEIEVPAPDRAALKRIKLDASKFVAERLDKEFKRDKEQGPPVQVNINLSKEDKSKIEKTLNTIHKNGAYEYEGDMENS